MGNQFKFEITNFYNPIYEHPNLVYGKAPLVGDDWIGNSSTLVKASFLRPSFLLEDWFGLIDKDRK